MLRKEDGLFKGSGENLNKTHLSDAFFSLLKYDPLDDDFSKKCLAANLTSTSNYLKVFPVDCETRFANSYFCFTSFLPCRKFNVTDRIREQTDLLLDPTQRQNLDFFIMKETNQVYDSLKSINRFVLYNIYNNLDNEPLCLHTKLL
jgi:hypothetical protein